MNRDERAAVLCFGSAARALAPRALVRPDLGGAREAPHTERAATAQRGEPCAPAQSVRVALRASGLRASDQALTEALLARAGPGGSEPRSAATGPHDERVLELTRAELERLIVPGNAAEILLATHELGHAPARPPRIMGIVNVTPDSFSDGGRYLARDAAVEHALELAAQGADVLDIGGESTRPGAEPVAQATELARVLPVIERLARATRTPISIDTTKAAVARAALDAGATIVNDVSAGRFDAAMLPLVAERGCRYLVMHMQGTPRDMQLDPVYSDVVADVLEFLRERVAACLAQGIALERITIDPGIGFGKRFEHNVALLTRLCELRSLGLPICLGVSRKSFLTRLSTAAGASNAALSAPSANSASSAGSTSATSVDAAERVGATAAAIVLGVFQGAELLRVHDVAPMAAAARTAFALRRAAAGERLL